MVYEKLVGTISVSSGSGRATNHNVSDFDFVIAKSFFN